MNIPFMIAIYFIIWWGGAVRRGCRLACARRQRGRSDRGGRARPAECACPIISGY